MRSIHIRSIPDSKYGDVRRMKALSDSPGVLRWPDRTPPPGGGVALCGKILPIGAAAATSLLCLAASVPPAVPAAALPAPFAWRRYGRLTVGARARQA